MNKQTLNIPKVAAEKGTENCEELIKTAKTVKEKYFKNLQTC